MVLRWNVQLVDDFADSLDFLNDAVNHTLLLGDLNILSLNLALYLASGELPCLLFVAKLLSLAPRHVVCGFIEFDFLIKALGHLWSY